MVSKNWTFLRKFLQLTYNKDVNTYFRDIDDEELEDLGNARKIAKRACLILPTETQNMAIIKQNIFWYIVQRIQDRPSVMGMTKGEYDQLFKYNVEIHFYFRQDSGAVPKGFSPMEGHLKIHLPNETPDSIKETKLKTLANKIDLEFGKDGGIIWGKAEKKFKYVDLEKGLNNSILATTEAEAIDIAQKLCSVAGATYDSRNLTSHIPKRSPVNNPLSKLILGKQQKQPRWRPSGNVRFRYAYAVIHGLPNPVYLVDKTGRYRNAYVFL